MFQKDTADKFSVLTIVFHWLVGLSIISLMAVGIYMEENKAYDLYPIHKSMGVIVFLFAIERIFWRIYNGWPTSLGESPAIQLTLAKLVHWVLILATLLFPISGMLMSGLGGHGIDVFGLQLMAPNYDPAEPGKAIPINGDIAGLAHQVHGILGKVMIGVILLHVAGALKHHFVDRDRTLSRMLGK